MCAGITHDAGHRSCTQNTKVDDRIAWLFGNVFLGANSLWWRLEHDDHHGHPLTFDDNTGVIDKQNDEGVWVQHERIFKFYTEQLHGFAFKQQGWTILPLALFAGRLGLMIDGFKTESSKLQWFGLFLHWTWFV